TSERVVVLRRERQCAGLACARVDEIETRAVRHAARDDPRRAGHEHEILWILDSANVAHVAARLAALLGLCLRAQGAAGDHDARDKTHRAHSGSPRAAAVCLGMSPWNTLIVCTSRRTAVLKTHKRPTSRMPRDRPIVNSATTPPTMTAGCSNVARAT